MGRPTPYKELAADTIDWKTEARVAIGDQSPGTFSFGPGQQEATLPWYVPANKVRSAIRAVLGYSWADDQLPWLLHREPPKMHPELGSLRAYAVSGVQLAPKSQDKTSDNPNRSPYKVSPFDPDQRYPTYTDAILSVQYRSFGGMRFLGDELISGFDTEWMRWTTFGYEPTVQTLNPDGYSLKFDEGPPATAGPPATPGGPGTPIAFPCQMPELMPQATLMLKWHAVPFEYVSADDNSLIPTKIASCLGTWNSERLFYGGNQAYAAGTCLLTGVRFEDTLFPVMPADPARVLRGLDITYQWLYSPTVSSVEGSQFRGHRVFPFRGTIASGSGPGWYHAVRLNGGDFLPGKDHARLLFQNVNDPR